MRALLALAVVLGSLAGAGVASAQPPLELPPLPAHVQAILDCEDPDFPMDMWGRCAMLLEVVGERWRCDKPLEEYGTPPIIVNQIQAQSYTPNQPGAVRLGNSAGGTFPPSACTRRDQVMPGGECVLDDRADLFLFVNGDGRDVGSSSDGIKVVGAHCIEIGDPTHPGGYVECGQPAEGAHQDGIVPNWAAHLRFYGFTSGDWGRLMATCHGAGGVYYSEQLTATPWFSRDVVCVRCAFVGSSPSAAGNFGRAVMYNGSYRSGARESCFAARIPVTRTLAPSPLPEGYLLQPRGGAVEVVDEGNLYVRLLAPGQVAPGQPDPASCPAFQPEPDPPPPTTTGEEPPDEPPTTEPEPEDPPTSTGIPEDQEPAEGLPGWAILLLAFILAAVAFAAFLIVPRRKG